MQTDEATARKNLEKFCQTLNEQVAQAYFAEGIAEAILNTLANLKELKVAGRTSSKFSTPNKFSSLE